MRALVITLITTIMISIVSCTGDNEAGDSTAVVENTVKTGTWIITRFEDSGNNETSKFTGYEFIFDARGTLTARNGGAIYIGSWSITGSKSNDDSAEDMHFNIIFNLNNVFEELSDDWHFISHSPSKIELINVSGGSGGTDYLTFERK